MGLGLAQLILRLPCLEVLLAILLGLVPTSKDIHELRSQRLASILFIQTALRLGARLGALFHHRLLSAFRVRRRTCVLFLIEDVFLEASGLAVAIEILLACRELMLDLHL